MLETLSHCVTKTVHGFPLLLLIKCLLSEAQLLETLWRYLCCFSGTGTEIGCQCLPPGCFFSFQSYKYQLFETGWHYLLVISHVTISAWVVSLNHYMSFYSIEVKNMAKSRKTLAQVYSSLATNADWLWVSHSISAHHTSQSCCGSKTGIVPVLFY